MRTVEVPLNELLDFILVTGINELTAPMVYAQIASWTDKVTVYEVRQYLQESEDFPAGQTLESVARVLMAWRQEYLDD